MRKLHIIMPMAGEGSRFSQEGITTPKPLIQFKGLPLFKRALNSLQNIEGDIKYSFIVREEHITNNNIDQTIKEILPHAYVFSVKQTTRGAVETCLLASGNMNNDDAILVLDCDLEFRCSEFEQYINRILMKSVEEVDGGALISFNSENPRYSYAQVDQENTVIKTAEKEVISNHALTGAYFFAKTTSFVEAANHLLNLANFNKPEFYLSLLYNYLISQKEVVKLFKVEEYSSYGTPEELNSQL